MKTDIFKAMAVNQGYVPPTCTLDGQLVMLLVKDGKDPCKGCNMNREVCKGRHMENYRNERGEM